jgi:pimeloyl-ACP methyl ester carboxylesterase
MSFADIVAHLEDSKPGLPPDCNFSERNGEPVLPFPELRCDAIYERLANLTYEEQAAQLRQMLADFLGGESPTPSEEDIDVIFAILSRGGLPIDAVSGVSYMNETYVRWHYRLVSLEQNLCVSSLRFRRTSPSGRVFNTLAFAGTGELAKDIELFRRAISADQISLSGYSYGTMVVPTYATLFPERVRRMVVDGVVPPERDLLSYLVPYTKGFFSVWQGIMTDCSTSVYQGFQEGSRCPLAPGPSSKVLQMISDNTNRTRASLVANVFLMSAVEIDVAPLAVDYAARAHAGEAEPDWCAQLPEMCSPIIPKHKEPIGPSKSGDRFEVTMIVGVLGLDVSGRLSEESLVAWWRDSLETFPFGTWRGLTAGAAMASWPMYSKPLPPPGKDGVKALVIGNLHDPQTDYIGAQRMRAAYPDGALMTWQGYGHCLPGESSVPVSSNLTQKHNNLALKKCQKQVSRFLSSGELPQDGHVCTLEEPLGLGGDSFDLSAIKLALALRGYPPK